jgi:hypothetical protein
MKIFNKDFIIDLQKTILWQYDKASKLRSLIDQKQAWYKINVTDFIANFFVNIFNLKTANDFGLSVWGRILNFPRQIFLNKYQITAEQTAGTDLTDIEVSRAVFNAKIESGDDFTAITIKEEEFKTFIFTYDGSSWDISGSVTANDVDIADYGITFTGTPIEDDTITVICDWTALNLTTEQYRFLLLGQVLKFRMNCTIPEINRYLRLIFNQKDNSNVYVTDNHNMTITYTIQPPVLDSNIQKLVNNYDFLPAPAGVLVIKSSAATFRTVKINTTPSNANVMFVIDGYGYNQNPIDVEDGSVINWTVSKDGYLSQSGTIVVNADTEFSVTLQSLSGILVFEALETSTIGYVLNGDLSSRDIKYSMDGSSFQSWNGSILSLNTGNKVYVKGNNINGLNTSYTKYMQFVMTGKIKASGNITSLLTDSENILTEIPNTHCFVNLFMNCSALTEAPILPSTTLKSDCYAGMFENCSNLNVMPELPALILPVRAYRYMFSGCTSLVAMKDIIATSYAEYACESMFSGCISLSKMKPLRATFVDDNGCREMFKGCINLTTPEPDFYNYLPATRIDDHAYHGMFEGCISIKEAPNLPATELGADCYTRMFKGCTSLKRIKISYTGNFFYYSSQLQTNFCLYTQNWVEDVPVSGPPYGYFYYNGSDTTRGVSAIPQNWIIRTFN